MNQTIENPPTCDDLRVLFQVLDVDTGAEALDEAVASVLAELQKPLLTT